MPNVDYLDRFDDQPDFVPKFSITVHVGNKRPLRTIADGWTMLRELMEGSKLPNCNIEYEIHVDTGIYDLPKEAIPGLAIYQMEK